MKENYEHKLYTHCEEKDADAVAWAFVNKEKMVKFPFKFPPIAANEVRANILYTGLCHSDVMTVREHWGPAMFPIAPGHEIIGEVSLVGSDVKDFKKGDLVAFGTVRDSCGKCRYCKKDREELCRDVEEHYTYGYHWGGYATALQQPASHFFHLPPNFKIEKGAPLLCAGITTYYPMKKFLKDGMNTAVIGIGGLGHIAIKFLKKLGHEVTAFTTSPNKIDMIKKELGADHVVISTDEKQMKEVADKFDFIINTLPTRDGLEKYINTLCGEGIFAQVGMPPVNACSFNLDAFTLVVKEAVFVGSNVGPNWCINQMLPLCAEKDIYPIVEEFSFEDFPKAFDKLENGRPHFRCVVNVKDWAEKHGFKK
jgi:uncharacterized zinc-type alcohol dehydrogenase-like protein